MFGYKLKSKNVERSFLTEDELTKISEKQFLTERLSQVRDVFIFCCFTGLAYSDIEKLSLSNIKTGLDGKKWVYINFCCFTGLAYSDIEKLSLSNIKTGLDGKKWVYINRTKTGTRSAVPLLTPAIAVLEKYIDHPYCITKDRALPVSSNQKMNEYLKEIATVCEIDKPRALPVSSNQKMNEYLKEIATVCEIDKPLSSHIARHTFATTVTLLNGVPMESVSKMLGHTNIRTTQIYAKVLDIKVSADMAILNDKY
ncbi:hypothetical protein ASE74_19445 [Pedobacter sp. Leaf216]|uniref:site-specific integrase n=1 Tax=Pedobacter sp. Leaf216 TaxID=1735684 RepID=UPI0006FC0F43|nr:hypothetical protein ASE74_19445 [Pedobacter sp. Leaf216]